MPWDALNAAESKVGVHTWSTDGLVWCWRLLRVLKWHSQWRQISSWILSQILMLMPSSPPPLCKCLTFFFLVPFSHLARSKCCKLALLVKMCFLHLLSLSLLLFLHLLLSALLFPAALVYRSIYSHAILSAIFLTVCSPPLPCHPPSLPLSLSVSPTLAGWLIHFIVCSPQVYPRKSTPAVDRLCVGVPAAEVSQMLLNNASTFSSL